MLNEYHKHDKVVYTLNSTTETYLTKGVTYPTGEGNTRVLATGRHL